MKPLIVANWKCNPTTLAEAGQLFSSVAKEAEDIKKAEIVICPPFVYLSNVLDRAKRETPRRVAFQTSNVKLGAQDIFWEKEGAFTGEISPLMLKDLGCEYVIVGHSERRKYFNETDETVNKKIKAALENDLIPVVCIGEKEGEDVEEVLKREIEEGLKGIDLSSVILAYEPIWVPLLYGGSVKSHNAAGYIKEANFQGLLVGGASLNAKEFIKIVKAAV